MRIKNLSPYAEYRNSLILKTRNWFISWIVGGFCCFSFFNLVMLKENFTGKDILMKKYGYSEGELLSPDMLSINLVSGGNVTPMEVTPAEGVAVETFDKVINDLNESSDDIYYTKRDSLDE